MIKTFQLIVFGYLYPNSYLYTLTMCVKISKTQLVDPIKSSLKFNYHRRKEPRYSKIERRVYLSYFLF